MQHCLVACQKSSEYLNCCQSYGSKTGRLFFSGHGVFQNTENHLEQFSPIMALLFCIATVLHNIYSHWIKFYELSFHSVNNFGHGLFVNLCLHWRPFLCFDRSATQVSVYVRCSCRESTTCRWSSTWVELSATQCWTLVFRVPSMKLSTRHVC